MEDSDLSIRPVGGYWPFSRFQKLRADFLTTEYPWIAKQIPIKHPA
jgi:hypothetical protein